MKIYWWQAGVHIDPESDEERQALGVLVRSLSSAKFLSNGLTGAPIDTIERVDKEKIVGFKEGQEDVS